MLVLDFSEDLFQHVLERDHPRRAAELVDHHGDVRPVLDEILQHGLQGHRLGHEIDLHHHVGDLCRTREEALRIDVPHDVVDRPAPDENPRILRIDETRGELPDRGLLDVHRLDVHARNHAVADAQVGEVQRILEKFQFVVRLGVLLRIVRLEQGGQVLAVEARRDVLLLDAPPQKAQNAVREQRREARQRIEQNVEEVDRRR